MKDKSEKLLDNTPNEPIDKLLKAIQKFKEAVKEPKEDKKNDRKTKV